MIRAITRVAAGRGVTSKIVCHGLMDAVLTPWAGRSWESTGQRALNRPRMAPGAPREPFLAVIEIWWLSQLGTNFAGPRGSVFYLGAAIFLAPPGGALRPGLAPAGWGALGGCPLARFGGKTAPPLVH
jgi:hypothetical protein